MTSFDGVRQPGAIIFDLDGTLVDTVDTRIEAWMRTFEEERIPADREHVAGLIGADGKKLAREVAQRAGKQLSDDDEERVDHRSGEIYDEVNTDPKPTGGAHSLLIALEESRLTWAIATSSRAAQVGTSVAALELPNEPLIVDGSHVEKAKPAPDLLLLAAQRVDKQPRDCWYVGDSTWDMMAAQAAGMTGVGVAYGAVGESDLSAAGAMVVTTLDQVEAELRTRGLLDK